MSRQKSAPLKVVLVGARGRMGKAVKELANRHGKIAIVEEVNCREDWLRVPEDAEVVIDFSNPNGLMLALDWCLKNQVPLVSGTTGLSPGQKSQLKRASKKIPVLHSANMSLGIAALVQMLGGFKGLEKWSLEIQEIHHKNKKDKPSGTALLIRDQLTSVTGRKAIKVRSERVGRRPGTHRILAKSSKESIFLEHVAHSRKPFAEGAVAAARWIFDKGQPGLYDLRDLYPV